jgi:carbamate kinase
MTLPLAVVALGGNAISPPRGGLSLAGERAAIDGAAAELAAIARNGARLLIVHGNGPQVGRLLAAPGIGDPESLDVHVAQTQGELGYLLAEALDGQLGREANVALVTRVLVDAADPAFANPTKPVGAVLSTRRPACHRADAGRGRVATRRRVAAAAGGDRQAAIGTLMADRHVVAGGGGGVVLAGAVRSRRPRPAVVDKDWIAALLAVAFDAAHLVFVTDVSHAFDHFGGAAERAIRSMRAREARDPLAGGMFAPGSMAPKIESAVQFVEATNRPAVIAQLGSVSAALSGDAGTLIEPAEAPATTS